MRASRAGKVGEVEADSCSAGEAERCCTRARLRDGMQILALSASRIRRSLAGQLATSLYCDESNESLSSRSRAVLAGISADSGSDSLTKLNPIAATEKRTAIRLETVRVIPKSSRSVAPLIDKAWSLA